MARKLTADDLDALNLILSRNPDLAEAIARRLDALDRVLNFPPPPEPTTAPEPARDNIADEARILAWLGAHPGKHGPKAIREALEMHEVPASEALNSLARLGKIKHEGKGAGRRFWA